MDEQIIRDSFKPLINEHSWNVKKGIGSFLTFEFGLPQLEIGEPKILKTSTFPSNEHLTRQAVIHGQYHLWIYCCNWKIQIGAKQIAFDESSDEEITNAIEFLNGQKLLEVTIDIKKAITNFKFDLDGGLITLNKTYESGMEMWVLYMPEQVLTFNNLGQFKLNHNDVRAKEEKFEPIDSENISINPT